MTQQLDLAFNTMNTTDKMMTNTSSSYNYQESKTDLGNKFDNFLDNANKNYSNTTKTDNKSYKQNDKNNLKDNKENKTYSYDKQETVKNTENTPVKSNVSKAENNEQKALGDVQNAEIKTTDDVSVETSQVISENDLKLQDVNNMILASSILPVNLSEVVSFDTSDTDTVQILPVLDMDIESELPADAIKSGIKFDADLTSVDTNNVDLDIVNNAVKEMSVSKEDSIASMYKQNSEVRADKDETTVIDLPKVDDKVQEHELKEVKEDLKVLVNDRVQVEEVSLKPEMTAENKIPENDKTVEVKLPAQDVVLDKKDEIEVKQNVAETETQNISKDDNGVLLDQNVETNKKEVSLKEENKNEDKIEVVQNKHQENFEPVQLSHMELREVAKTNVKAATEKDVKNIAFTEDKTEKLKEEISSATLENTANIAQKTDKKEADLNAKTNVNAKETMDVKDDVSGIQFENVKTSEKTDDTKQIAEQADKVKQKVENIKIQTEDNVKVNPQVQLNKDENRVARANETLDKAGLSTENLQKMDGKITELQTSDKHSQSDLGQSSQEMLMRDMLQNSSSNSDTATVEMKTDFTQTLDKTIKTANPEHAMQAKEEAPEVNILDQIRAKFAANSQNGMQKITIGLTPESLGKLNIEITKGQNGISAQILADNPQAKEILDKNLDGLKSVLQSQGVNVNNVNVKVAEAGRSSDSNNNMFNGEEGKFDSNQNRENSRNQEDTNRENRSEFEFVQKEVLKDFEEDAEEVSEKTVLHGKTVNIKGGSGNIKYQL